MHKRITTGNLKIPHDRVPLFPTVVVFTETPTHYAFELFGARRQHRKLTTKRKSVESFNRFLGDFNYDGPTEYICVFNPLDRIPTEPRFLIANTVLAAQKTIHALKTRFPGVTDLVRSNVVRVVPDEVECIKSFDGSGLDHALIISNCLITNSLGSLIRAHYTNLFLAIPRNMEPQEFSRTLNEQIPSQSVPYAGLQIVRAGQQEAIAQAGQFANLYLRGLQETTLTKFLEDHADIIQSALGAEKIFFQPEFTWREGNTNLNGKPIRPDVIMRRNDGVWYIIEFKLPLLDRVSVTTGGPRRRRFIDTIDAGMSQIFTYGKYFDYEMNRRSAAIKLGEEVKDPKLMLVVGNSENVSLTEVREAMLSRGAIDILDYDALIRMSVGFP